MWEIYGNYLELKIFIIIYRVYRVYIYGGYAMSCYGDVGAVSGAGKGESLWTKTAVKPKVENLADKGMTASFAPNGQNFLETVKSTYSDTGNNCAGF